MFAQSTTGGGLNPTIEMSDEPKAVTHSQPLWMSASAQNKIKLTPSLSFAECELQAESERWAFTRELSSILEWATDAATPGVNPVILL